MSNRSSSRSRAFTLIELLTVCAIIAIVAGIITPVLLYAKASAKASACLSNSMQLSKAMLMYMEDNSGAVASAGSDEYYWMDQLKGYGVTELSVKCPTFTPIPEVGRGSGWALNVCLAPGGPISSAANIVMFTEATEGTSTGPDQPNGILWPKALSAPDWFLYRNPCAFGSRGTVCTMAQPFGSKRHFGRSNYAFVDGHSGSFAPEGIRLPSNLSCQGGPDTWTGPSSGPVFRTK